MIKHLYIALALAITLTSCGARKSEVHKAKVETEKTTTDESKISTTEGIKETITATIDTTVIVPKKQAEVSKPLLEVVNGQPLIYEDEDIRSETSYDNITGAITNKTTRKEQNIPVKGKQVTQRTIKRDIQQQNDIKTSEKSKSETKDKIIDKKESFMRYWWILLIVLAIYIAYKIYRKSRLFS